MNFSIFSSIKNSASRTSSWLSNSEDRLTKILSKWEGFIFHYKLPPAVWDSHRKLRSIFGSLENRSPFPMTKTKKSFFGGGNSTFPGNDRASYRGRSKPRRTLNRPVDNGGKGTGIDLAIINPFAGSRKLDPHIPGSGHRPGSIRSRQVKPPPNQVRLPWQSAPVRIFSAS